MVDSETQLTISDEVAITRRDTDNAGPKCTPTIVTEVAAVGGAFAWRRAERGECLSKRKTPDKLPTCLATVAATYWKATKLIPAGTRQRMVDSELQTAETQAEPPNPAAICLLAMPRLPPAIVIEAPPVAGRFASRVWLTMGWMKDTA